VHVIALANDPSAGAAYRAELPMRAIADLGHRAEFVLWDHREAPPFEQLRHADVVHMWRHFRAPARQLARALREAGVAVVFDNDDDMTRVPKGSPAYREMNAARAQVANELGGMLRLADLVTTTCAELAGRMRRLGAGDVRVVENYVEAGFLRERRVNGGDGVVIGWVAGAEHRGDLKELRLRRTLEQLLEAQPHVWVTSVGVDLGIRGDRYTHVENVPFPELPDTIATFDLALAPIADVSFNRVRSSIKVKEYAAAGVPWLGSPIGPYKELGAEQGGRLVPDYGWAEALTDLVTDAPARAALAERAAAWGRTQTVTHNAGKWEAAFAQAAARAGRATGSSLDQRDPSHPGPSVPGAAGRRSRTIVPRPNPPAGASPSPGAGDGAGSPPRRGIFRRRAGR
jgi:glycosyltransferase involved in cell wall biosynthesis